MRRRIYAEKADLVAFNMGKKSEVSGALASFATVVIGKPVTAEEVTKQFTNDSEFNGSLMMLTETNEPKALDALSGSVVLGGESFGYYVMHDIKYYEETGQRRWSWSLRWDIGQGDQ